MSLTRYDRLENLQQALFWEPTTPIMIATFKPFAVHGDDTGKKQTEMAVVAAIWPSPRNGLNCKNAGL